MKYHHGQLIPDKGYWCEFCQMIHSASGCYHTAYQRMKIVEAQKADLLAALKEIFKGEGPFSTDRLTHANNTIENMMAIAEQAIADQKAVSDA